MVLRNRYLTYQQAAVWLGVTVGQLRIWVHRGTIPHIRLGPRTVRFDRSALRRFLQSRTVQASS